MNISVNRTGVAVLDPSRERHRVGIEMRLDTEQLAMDDGSGLPLRRRVQADVHDAAADRSPQFAPRSLGDDAALDEERQVGRDHDARCDVQPAPHPP
ncbi:MAG: hypothetical protein WD336_05650 [Trueperaceae bacterium]